MKRVARQTVVSSPAALKRRIGTELGRTANGKFVAADRQSGRYVVADALDGLLDAIERSGLRGPRLHIFRVGSRAAVELRRQ